VIQTRLDNKRSRVYTRAWGTVTFEELQTHIKELMESRVHLFPELFDASEARTNMSSAEMQQIARLAQETEPNDRPAALAIVTSDPYAFGMAHMYQALCEDIRAVGVFRGITPAAKWLATQEPPPITDQQQEESN
jgi:hypothetical protein